MDNSIWERIRGGFKTLLPPHIFTAFVERADASQVNGKSLKIQFADRFSKENFEQKCMPLLPALLASMELQDVDVSLDVADVSPAGGGVDTTFFANRNPFDSKYTFETYVIGTSNQFAHAACQAVSKQPGQCYNPLFIFGGAGLGKTHLLRAIGRELLTNQSNLKVQFLTSETFTNELIQAIRVDRMREFREKYRQGCDVLLLDDVHFLAGKERTQEEFFYTFNYLHESRKQIVITSDRYPKDIQGLENRLQTRFEWGLVADVQPPEVETRIAILQNKAAEEHIELPDNVAQYIASHITTNIRELEGSLHRLQAYAALTSVPISLDLAHQILKDIAPKIKHEVTADGILKLVALEFGVRTTDLKSEKRVRSLTVPRQICIYLIRKHLLISYPEIAKIFAKDHSTIMYACDRIGEMLRQDPEIESHVTKIEALIR
jgi:chromosomal replication initiator protein